MKNKIPKHRKKARPLEDMLGITSVKADAVKLKKKAQRGEL